MKRVYYLDGEPEEVSDEDINLMMDEELCDIYTLFNYLY